MAGGGFVITIKAIDAATKQIEEVNKSLHRLNAPVERFGKSLKKLGEQTHITEAFKKTKEAIGGAVEKLTEFLPMLGVLTAGGIAAGLAEIVHGWSTFATQLSISSKWLGMNTDQLQGLQNATRLAGGSAAEANASYEKLDDTLQDAAAGRNHEAAMLLTSMGLNWRKGALQAKSAAEMMPQIWEKLHTMGGNAATKRALAARFGITGAQFKVAVEEGAAGYERLQEEARKHGLLSKENTDILEREHEAFTGLTLSVENFTSKIAVGLAPQILDLIGRFEAWLSNGKNVDDTVKTITGTVEKLVTWSQWLWEKVNGLVQICGGWKDVLETIIALKLGGFVFGLIAPFVQVAAAITGAATATTGLATAAKGAMAALGPLAVTLASIIASYEALKLLESGSRKVEGAIFGEDRAGMAERLRSLGPAPTQEEIEWAKTGKGERPQRTGNWFQRNMPGWFGGGSPTTVETNIPTAGRALMDTIADKESHGSYDAKNPTSTAKGRYQFLDSTWDRVSAITGRKERTPENQDINAWWLMRDDYKRRTGRDLETDLNDPSKRSSVVAGLRATWPSLPGGSQTLGSQDDFDKRYAAHLTAEGARVGPIAGNQPATIDGRVDINVNHSGGGTVTATSSGRNVAAPRINTPMVPYGGGLG